MAVASEDRRISRPIVCLLDDLPDIEDSIPPEQLAGARRDLRAAVVTLQEGASLESQWPRSMLDGAGLLVLDGLLLRRVGIDGRYGCELLSTGDLLRPWQREEAAASMAHRSGWRVLKRSRLAQLDVAFLRRAGAYPEVLGALVARCLRRSRSLAVNMAIVHHPRVETRVHMLLWHFADRWGTVRKDGVLLPVPLTHALLADLVAAQRPTVSAAIGALQREGSVERVDGGWMLHGSPPGELVTPSDL
ncbi:MAG TPA: helix-turn-helix domain-containing protein [Solirubrobacteraceae bacterium]|nr:helix-turn-helix domain-containing protein [Solirubrobacteraceae bacterium]